MLLTENRAGSYTSMLLMENRAGSYTSMLFMVNLFFSCVVHNHVGEENRESVEVVITGNRRVLISNPGSLELFF